MPDGRIAYRLKRPWPDGRTEPPRRHLVRYSGVFGPAAKRRSKLRALVPARDDGRSPDPC
jgi:hypothetical protein